MDLLLSRVLWPIDMSGDDIPADTLAARITEEIPRLDVDALNEVYMDLHGEEAGEWVDVLHHDDGSEETIFQPFPETPDNWENKTRDRLLRAVDDIFGKHADVEMLDQEHGLTWLLAGGSSAGDDPCTEFRSLIILEIAGLLWSARPVGSGVYVLTGYENGWPTLAIGPFPDRTAAAERSVIEMNKGTGTVTLTDDPHRLPIQEP